MNIISMKQNENFREKKTNDFVYFVFDQYQREDIKIYLKKKEKLMYAIVIAQSQ